MKIKIYSIDEIYKALGPSHEPKKPPKMESRLKTVKPYAEGYIEPKRMHPSSGLKPPQQSFHIHREKGIEETKRRSKLQTREKRIEQKEEKEIYGETLD